jgi:hypothetical protein
VNIEKLATFCNIKSDRITDKKEEPEGASYLRKCISSNILLGREKSWGVSNCKENGSSPLIHEFYQKKYQWTPTSSDRRTRTNAYSKTEPCSHCSGNLHDKTVYN